MKNQISQTKVSISKSRRIAFCAMFTALALALSIMESYFPVGILIPVPGIKLGLANIVTVFAIVSLSPVDTVLIILVRCFVMGLFTGPVSFMFSLFGAIFAFIVMQIMTLGLGRIFSVVGISMGGAVMHNAGQILAAVIVMKDTGLIFAYLPFLMLIALLTGALTGFAAMPVITNLMKYFNKTKVSVSAG